MLKEAIGHCESVGDYVSREILEDILKDTEEHIDYLETQVSLLGSLGEQNYLQSAMGEITGPIIAVTVPAATCRLTSASTT